MLRNDINSTIDSKIGDSESNIQFNIKCKMVNDGNGVNNITVHTNKYSFKDNKTSKWNLLALLYYNPNI